jgi:rubrerythrin
MDGGKTMSGDLISRDALADELIEELDWERAQSVPETATAAFKIAMRRVKKAPAVDAEPVRHGRWVFSDDDDLVWWWLCSECGNAEAMPTRYCPECGANMEGGDSYSPDMDDRVQGGA